ncbi:PAS domain S-box protein [Tumidithrix elongata RA019]|uniref:histidine kinase n=1 Tax=Tumidithrix elongata BACA0141 TaxID=2716417 RepID=A0AAW9PU59_9CYAN|nr:PAS domain S-box protein [Tumidithrix elongata RA019]
MVLSVCHELLDASVQNLQKLQAAIDPATQSGELRAVVSALSESFASLQKAIAQVETQQEAIATDCHNYRELFEFAPDGYFVTDETGIVQSANRAATVILGSDLIGQNLKEYVLPANQEQFQRFLGQLQRGQNLKSLDLKMLFPTGQPFDATFTILSVRDGNGKVVALRWWIQDTTERKQDEEQLWRANQQLEIRLASLNAKMNLLERQIRSEREEQSRVARHLAHNEGKLRALMQHSSDIVNIIDTDASIQYCSPSVFRILGFQPEDIVGKKLVQFIHPDDLPIFQSFLSQSQQAISISPPMVMRYRHINGDWVYLESVCNDLVQDPNIQGIVINSRDITDRKRTQTALQESELRLAAIAASMPGTFYRLVWNPDGTVTLPFISDGLIELTGMQPKQAMARPDRLADLVYLDDREQFEAMVRAGIEKLATFRREFRIVTKSGEVKWVQDIARYYRSEDGSTIADGVCIDISERGDVESELQRAHELLQAVVRSSPVSIDIISPEGKVLLWNPAAEKIFGWSAAEVIGNPLPVTMSQSDSEFQVFLETLAGDGLNAVETVYPCKDGTTLDVSLSTAQVKDAEGKILGVLRIIEDISDRKRKEAELRRLESLVNAQTATELSLHEAAQKNGNGSFNFMSAYLQNGTSALASGQLLLSQYASGKREFLGWNLCGVSLANADLQQSNLSGSQLNGSDLGNTNLQRANLRGVDLRGANLHKANLNGTDLRGADLRGADLHDADLRDANLMGVSIDEAALAGAILSGENVV